jgi:hypothetical protein
MTLLGSSGRLAGLAGQCILYENQLGKPLDLLEKLTYRAKGLPF